MSSSGTEPSPRISKCSISYNHMDLFMKTSLQELLAEQIFPSACWETDSPKLLIHIDQFSLNSIENSYFQCFMCSY